MLYTIGHSSHTVEYFVELLRAHNIEVVVDVRSSPFSRRFPHFNQPVLRSYLRDVGIKYVPMGDELGGRPDSPYFYDEKGHVDYGKIARTEFFQKGLDRLQRGMERYRIALMCSEENPNECHRRLLIARALCDSNPSLRERIFHIRGNGCVVSELELYQRERQKQVLFQFEEVKPWRSPKSIR